MQTIKFNPFNLRALKDKLPKANYEKEEPMMQIISESPKGAPKVEQKEEPRQTRESIKPRERLKSAENMRPPIYAADSPRIAVHKQNEAPRNDSRG